MKPEIRSHPVHGRILWISDGTVDVAGALDFGVRIVHLSAAGKENLLYVQPADLSDGLATPEGWRIHGGHRFWGAPESERSYYPDNDPVEYEELPNGFLLRQKTDPWTQTEKTLAVTLTGNGSVEVVHTLTYVGEEELTAAAWGVTTLRGGGSACSPFPRCESGSEFQVNRTLALWGATSLADQRLTFSGDEILARHDGSSAYFKMGIYNARGCIRMENLGQELRIGFAVHPLEAYAADRGCNAELFMDPNVMELETLGVTKTLKKGESVSHTEYWKVS